MRTTDPGHDDLSELRLDGRIALITGGARGLGEATARLLARRGAGVLLFDLDKDKVVETANSMRSAALDVRPEAGNVTDSSACERAVETCLKTWGRLDILVNSAGIGGRSVPVWELSDDDWRTVLDVNLNGLFYMTRAAIRPMRSQGWGRIVNVASMAGKEGNANSSHYSSAKAGVIGFTKSVGKELATEGVLVNAIAPAVIDTDIIKSQPPEHIERLLAKVPMGRLGTSVEVARLVAFLVSEHTTFSTGAVFDLSGGRAVY